MYFRSNATAMATNEAAKQENSNSMDADLSQEESEEAENAKIDDMFNKL